MKNKISMIVIFTLLFTTIFGTFVYADSSSSSIVNSASNSNSTFLKQAAPLVENGDMQITRNVVGKDGARNYEVKYSNGLMAKIKEQTLKDGKTQLNINEGKKNDIIIYNPQDDSYMLNGNKVTLTEEVEYVDNTVINDSSVTQNSDALVGISSYVSGSDPISDWTLKSTTKKGLEMGTILDDIAVSTIVYILMGFTGFVGVAAAVISFLLGSAITILPSFLQQSKIFAKTFYYVGTSGTSQLYSKYRSDFYLNSACTTFAHCFHTDIYYRGVFSYAYYGTDV